MHFSSMYCTCNGSLLANTASTALDAAEAAATEDEVAAGDGDGGVVDEVVVDVDAFGSDDLILLIALTNALAVAASRLRIKKNDNLGLLASLDVEELVALDDDVVVEVETNVDDGAVLGAAASSSVAKPLSRTVLSLANSHIISL
jgi:hypothetical protein